MSAIRLFRLLGHLEGTSYLLLLFVAMPLKYLQAQPVGVRILGPIHGVLFVAYLVFLMRLAPEKDWRAGKIAKAVLASLVPFGMFFFLPTEADDDGSPAKAAEPPAP